MSQKQCKSAAVKQLRQRPSHDPGVEEPDLSEFVNEPEKQDGINGNTPIFNEERKEEDVFEKADDVDQNAVGNGASDIDKKSVELASVAIDQDQDDSRYSVPGDSTVVKVDKSPARNTEEVKLEARLFQDSAEKQRLQQKQSLLSLGEEMNQIEQTSLPMQALQHIGANDQSPRAKKQGNDFSRDLMDSPMVIGPVAGVRRNSAN